MVQPDAASAKASAMLLLAGRFNTPAARTWPWSLSQTVTLLGHRREGDQQRHEAKRGQTPTPAAAKATTARMSRPGRGAITRLRIEHWPRKKVG